MLDQQLITVTDGQLNFVSDGFSGSNGYNLNYIDIVAVPEPATLGLSALGIGAVLLRRRRG
ncbi:MAG TPA: PEP-CTERM sorting domain-containing protein [Phycisphaeraceae bacterium]